MASIADLQKLDIRAGIVIEVEDFPKARIPSYRIRVDFGPEIGEKRSSVHATNYRREELLGMQVVAVVNLPPKNVAGFLSEVLVLGVPSEDGEVSLLTPSRRARLGSAVY